MQNTHKSVNSLFVVMNIMFTIDYNCHLTIAQDTVTLFIVLLDPFNKLFIDLLTVAWCPIHPLVICRACDVNSSTELLDRIFFGLVHVFYCKIFIFITHSAQ